MNVLNLKSGFKLLINLILITVMVGCGGGTAETTTSSGNSSSSNTGNDTGSANLTWEAPTENTDGSTIASLGGFKIYVNDGSGFVLLADIDNPGVLEYLVENLNSGTYTFVVTAYDSDGIESTFSNEAIITI